MGSALLAIDVGGTDIKAALFDAAGTELAAGTAPTPAGPAESRPADPGGAVLEAAAELARSLGGPAPAAVGLVVPGIVDEAAGTGVYSANLGWRGYPFRDRARELFGVPVGFAHDVGMAGEAEIAAGAGGASGDAAVVVIGTGIAAALFDGGRRVRGSGFAGELGHLMVPHDGGWRLLESVASAAAIGRAFGDRLGRDPGAEPLGSREVFEEAGLLGGAPGPHAETAQAVLDAAFDSLAFALLQVATLLGTDHVVLTGGLARAGEALRAPIAARLDAATTFQRPLTVALGVLGARAGLLGALECARRAQVGASA